MISFLFLVSLLAAPFLGHGLDRDVAISHLEKYISVTKSEEQFASEVTALKEKLSSVAELRAAGQTSEADELDKSLDSEISTLRQNIAKHASGSSAQARQKQSSEDIRARVEQTMSKFGKDRPSRESQGDAPTPRDPEELKRLHEDMLNKQKDFISHRKEELQSRVTKAGFNGEELSDMNNLIDEYIALENEVLESRTQHFTDSSSSMDTNQRIQYHMDMKVKRDKEKKASDNARLKRKEIDDALRKKLLASRTAAHTQQKATQEL